MTTLKDVMTRSEPTSKPTSKPLNKIIFIADSPPTQNIVTQLGQFNKMIVFDNTTEHIFQNRDINYLQSINLSYLWCNTNSEAVRLWLSRQLPTNTIYTIYVVYNNSKRQKWLQDVVPDYQTKLARLNMLNALTEEELINELIGYAVSYFHKPISKIASMCLPLCFTKSRIQSQKK